MWWSTASLLVLQFLALAPRTQASMAEAWGAPPRMKASKPDSETARAKHVEHEARVDEAMSTARRGALERHASLMRKESENDVHHAGSEFHNAAQHAVELGELQHALIHEHRTGQEPETETAGESDSAGDSNVVETVAVAHSDPGGGAVEPGSWLTSCGNHKAPSCADCPTTGADGVAVSDHGYEWCNGDCAFQDGVCHPKASVTIAEGATQGASQGFATTPLPDILNPDITAHDEATINKAAEEAVKEEKREDEEKVKAKEEEAKNKGPSWGKFWLVVIITFSAILGICTVVSCTALVVFCCFARPPEKDMGNESDALTTDGEAEAEGEAGDSSDGEAAATAGES